MVLTSTDAAVLVRLLVAGARLSRRGNRLLVAGVAPALIEAAAPSVRRCKPALLALCDGRWTRSFDSWPPLLRGWAWERAAELSRQGTPRATAEACAWLEGLALASRIVVAEGASA